MKIAWAFREPLKWLELSEILDFFFQILENYRRRIREAFDMKRRAEIEINYNEEHLPKAMPKVGEVSGISSDKRESSIF